jgi:hypothetical protein
MGHYVCLWSNSTDLITNVNQIMSLCKDINTEVVLQRSKISYEGFISGYHL